MTSFRPHINLKLTTLKKLTPFSYLNFRDIFCGSLICSPALEDTSFWKNIYFFSSLTGNVNTEDGRKDCRGILLDVGRSTPNPSYVLDGTKCETNKVSISLRATCGGGWCKIYIINFIYEISALIKGSLSFNIFQNIFKIKFKFSIQQLFQTII